MFGPVFRYFDVFDAIGDFGILTGKPKLARWRSALAVRPSVKSAVSPDYPVLLRDFLDRRRSHISRLQAKLAALSCSNLGRHVGEHRHCIHVARGAAPGG